MDNDDATKWASEMAHEANEGERLAALKLAVLKAIQDGIARSLPDLMVALKDFASAHTLYGEPLEVELADQLLALRWEGAIRQEGDTYTPGMETMFALMVEAAKVIGMPVDGEMEVGAQGFGARNDDWAGEVRVIGDGLVLHAEVNRVTLRIVVGYSVGLGGVRVEPLIRWSSVGSVSPEDAAAFAVSVGEMAARAEHARDLLAPIAAMADHSEREALAKRTERWLIDHEVEAANRLRAALGA
jgi:hypothetical protein